MLLEEVNHAPKPCLRGQIEPIVQAHAARCSASFQYGITERRVCQSAQFNEVIHTSLPDVVNVFCDLLVHQVLVLLHRALELVQVIKAQTCTVSLSVESAGQHTSMR